MCLVFFCKQKTAYEMRISDWSSDVYSSDRGRRVAPQGAAMAGAGSIDAIDAHDGHRLTKGHAGVTIVPALLAFCDEMAPCDGAEFLTRLVLGYEIATRAGIALHRTAAALAPLPVSCHTGR